MTQSPFLAPSLLALGLLGCGGGGAAAPEGIVEECGPLPEATDEFPAHRGAAAVLEDEPFDLIVVTIDTVRADRLSCYGYPRRTSPTLDQLAARGVRFERCVAPAPTTLPSHTSMFTGVAPFEHGVLANLHLGLVYERDPNLVTLAQVLAGQGYDTGGFVSALPLRTQTRIHEGFRVWSQPKRGERPGSQTTDQALRYIEQARDPMFLWVHWFDPHNPYAPPAPWDTVFDPEDGVVAAWMEARGIGETAHRLDGKPVDLRRANEAYDGELRATDEELARLMAALEARGRLERSVIVVVGDHGEGLGQHEVPSHGFAWDDELRVPWIVVAPGLEPGVVEEVASVTDLVPTLAPLMPGVDLSALLSQASGVDRLGGGVLPAYVHSQSSPRQSSDRALDHALRGRRWKLLRQAEGTELLFDLLADPHEQMDVAGQHPEVRAALSAQLDEVLARESEGHTTQTREASDEESDVLEAMGYGGGD